MASTDLVGRLAELSAVTSALDSLSREGGKVLLFAGGAGLGKSRLASEAIALALERGIKTAVGRCRETEGAPAFWPWTQVLRAISDAPEITSPGDSSNQLRDPFRDPFRTYDAIARALARAAADAPLLVVLDDLHNADAGSLRALRFIATDLDASRIVLLGTYRDEELTDDHLLAQFIGEAATSRSTRLFELAGLDDASVAKLIASITGSQIDGETAVAVRERTGGNPFFVAEVARLGLTGSVPHGVREAIRARLRRLPEPTRAALSISSVLGRDFGGELFSAVSELSGVSLVAALQPAAQARLIAADSDRQGRYRFIHALVQEVLYADLPDDLRRATHARAVAAIEALPSAERNARICELAFHASGAVNDAASRARAMTLCEAAGRRSETALAYEDAAAFYARAIAFEPEKPPIELLFAQADALARTQQGRVARKCYETAFELATRVGDGPKAARAALGVGEVVVSAGVIDEPLVRMLSQAQRIVGESDVNFIRLEARRAIELYWQADVTFALEAAARAVLMAEKSGDKNALGAALNARRFVLRGPDNLDERIDIGERLVRLAIETRDEDLELSAYAWLIPEHMARGDLVAVARAEAALSDLAGRVRRPIARWHTLLFQGFRAGFEGRFADALALADAARTLGLRVGSQPAAMFSMGQRAVILRDLGRADEAIREVREFAANFPILVTCQCELAMLLAEAGETAEAREILERVARDDFAMIPRDSLWRASVALAAQAAATLGHAEHARASAKLLAPYVGINVVQGVPVAWGAVDHYVGVALAAAGLLDEAITHLGNAVRLHAQWGAAALSVASQAELANTLHRRGRAEDRPRVTGLEAAVRSEAARLGIVRPLLSRDARATTSAASSTSSARKTPHGLTEREIQILRLLTIGRANKEIAHALRISVHTVERHIANLYAKVGARNRADAAAFAVANGLGD